MGERLYSLKLCFYEVTHLPEIAHIQVKALKCLSRRRYFKNIVLVEVILIINSYRTLASNDNIAYSEYIIQKSFFK